MPIPYALYPNPLTPGPSDFAARTKPYRGVGFAEIAARINKKGTTVSKSDILAVLEEMEVVVEEILLEGNRVALGGLAQLFPRLKGVFDTEEDGFDPARHQLDVGASPGKRVRTTVRTLGEVAKLYAEKPQPKLRTFTDAASGEKNGTATPGDIAHLTGQNMQFDPDQADEGAYFVPSDGGPAVKVSSVSVNRQSLLSFLIPALTPGSFRLEVRSRLRGVQDLRTGRLEPALVVPS